MGIVDDERRAADAELAAAVRKKAQAHGEILAAIKRCREADIPITRIANTIGVHRVTIYEWTKEEG